MGRATSMSRAAKRILPVIGAAIFLNLLVTWMIAVARPQLSSNAVTTYAATVVDGACWNLRRHDSNGMTRLYWTTSPPVAQLVPFATQMGTVPAWSRVARKGPSQGRMGQGELLVEVGFGWPLIAACYEYKRFGTGWTSPHSPVFGAIDLGDRQTAGSNASTPRIEVLALPYRFCWIGVVVNSATYAALLSVPLLLRRFARRYIGVHDRRLKAGVCPQCGYDLQHDLPSGCSECGWNRR